VSHRRRMSSMAVGWLLCRLLTCTAQDQPGRTESAACPVQTMECGSAAS
jgi:hypothetical protein